MCPGRNLNALVFRLPTLPTLSGRAFQYPSFCRDLLGKTGADKGRGMPFADPVDPQPATGVSVLESSLLHLSSLTNLRRYRHVGAPLQPNIRERKLRPTKTNAEHYYFLRKWLLHSGMLVPHGVWDPECPVLHNHRLTLTVV